MRKIALLIIVCTWSITSGFCQNNNKQKEDSTKGSAVTTKKNSNESSFDISKALYVVDGKVTESSKMESIDPSMILSIGIKNDTITRKKYGKEGENGVVFITTKTNK